MPEKTKKPGSPGKENNKTGAESDNDAPVDDRERRSYYYDDAHGYEIYDAEEVEEEEDETDGKKAPSPENL